MSIWRILVSIGLVLLTSCEPVTSAQPTFTASSSPMLPSTTPSPTNTQIPITPVPTRTSVPTIRYQLTFVQDHQSIVGMDVDCLESEQICFDDPQVLITFPEEPNQPRLISWYHWSPEGNRIAISAVGNSGFDDIFWSYVDNVAWVNITNTPIYECNPIWSLDGQQLIYEANSYELYGGHRIFSTTLDKEVSFQLLTQGFLGDEQELALSPDGNRFAFIHSDENGFYQLFVADVNGSNRRQLTDLPAHHFFPAFSPNGAWLAFIRVTDPYSTIIVNGDQAITNIRSHLVVMSIETNEEITLFSGNSENDEIGNPAWAPFGNWIGFSSNIGGDYDVYIVNPDDGELIQVTSSHGSERGAEWRVYFSP